MSIEKDLKQRVFRNEYSKVILNIMFTNNYLVNTMNEVFKNFDITRQQYNVLRILRGQYPHHASINLIRDRMLDKMSDASRIVERLRIKELIYRKECVEDKRSVEVTISEKGLELLKKMDHEVNQTDNLVSNLTLQEARILNELLDKIRENSKNFESSDSLNDKMYINP